MQAQNLALDSSGVLTGVLDPLSQITWLVSGKRKTQPCGPQGGGNVSSRPSRERTARLQTRHYPRILDAAWALDIPGPLSSDETPPSCVLATPGPSPVPWQSSALPGIRWFFSHSQRRDLLLPLSPHRSAVPLTCSPRRSQIQRQSGRWGPGPGAGG